MTCDCGRSTITRTAGHWCTYCHRTVKAIRHRRVELLTSRQKLELEDIARERLARRRHSNRESARRRRVAGKGTSKEYLRDWYQRNRDRKLKYQADYKHKRRAARA